MDNLSLVTTLSWLLAAFFLVGAALNTFVPKKMRDDYARWGYPSWFHYVTAILEFGVAVMLLFPEQRALGSLLGVSIMAAAAGTTLLHREYTRAIAPAIVLILTATVGWMSI